MVINKHIILEILSPFRWNHNSEFIEEIRINWYPNVTTQFNFMILFNILDGMTIKIRSSLRHNLNVLKFNQKNVYHRYFWDIATGTKPQKAHGICMHILKVNPYRFAVDEKECELQLLTCTLSLWRRVYLNVHTVYVSLTFVWRSLPKNQSITW